MIHEAHLPRGKLIKNSPELTVIPHVALPLHQINVAIPFAGLFPPNEIQFPLSEIQFLLTEIQFLLAEIKFLLTEIIFSCY